MHDVTASRLNTSTTILEGLGFVPLDINTSTTILEGLGFVPLDINTSTTILEGFGFVPLDIKADKNRSKNDTGSSGEQ